MLNKGTGFFKLCILIEMCVSMGESEVCEYL